MQDCSSIAAPTPALGNPALKVFLVHPGGPFWAKKDLGAWSIPKGEYGVDEEPLAAALREFEEETSFSQLSSLPVSAFIGALPNPSARMAAKLSLRGPSS